MTKLTRRPDGNDRQVDGWFVYYGDVQVGHIGKRTGAPASAPQWTWSCGFYPGCDPGESTNGSAVTFDEARAAFNAAWTKLAATRTEGHYELWRQFRDFSVWKDRMHDQGLPLPTARTDGRSHCFCGSVITISSFREHVETAHRGIRDA